MQRDGPVVLGKVTMRQGQVIQDICRNGMLRPKLSFQDGEGPIKKRQGLLVLRVGSSRTRHHHHGDRSLGTGFSVER